uniref:regulator of G-protein signaling 9-like n=1 Tax=Myxine glutinosa TaxID=7769 RepID=UPI00358F69D4
MSGFDKVEMLVGAMQDPEMGVNMFDQRLLLTVIPHAVRGHEILGWIVRNLKTSDEEALNLSNLLVRTGYVYPLMEPAIFSLQPDDSIYRFQGPYFWPSKSWPTEDTDYAIYLAKKNVMKNGDLADYEKARYQHLHAKINHKWDFIIMQAKEQMSAVKERRRGDRLVLACQEQAFWLIQRPPPDTTCVFEQDNTRMGSTSLAKQKSAEYYKTEIYYCSKALVRARVKSSTSLEGFVRHYDRYASHDPIMSGCLPSNPWISQDPSLWSLHASMVEVPARQRVECWAFSFKVLLNDPRGRQELREFLLKEFSAENLSFWESCEDLKSCELSNVKEKAEEIFGEFLSPGAKHWINLDARTVAMTVAGMKQPFRLVFEEAQGHIYLLMKKDCYPRYLKSERYKSLLERAIVPQENKRRIFPLMMRPRLSNPPITLPGI